MSSSEILARFIESFEDTIDTDGVEIKLETTADDIEAWDSLSHVRLVVAIEKEFKVRFSTVEIENLNNVNDFVALIGSKLG